MATNNLQLHNLNIVNWNANGITAKRSSFITFLAQHHIDIACVTETHLVSTERFTIPGYAVYRFDRDAPKASGGVAIIIKRNISHHSMYLPYMNNLEIVGVKFVLNSQDIVLYSAYHAPRHKFSKTYLETLFVPNVPTILLGDLNCKHVAWGCNKNNPNGRRLLSALHEFNLTISAPEEPTHYPTNLNATPDVLDIGIFQSFPLPSQVNALAELDSDHLPVILAFNQYNVKMNIAESLIKGQVNWELFKTEFDKVFDLPTVFNTRWHIDQSINCILQSISIAIENSTIKKFKQVSTNHYSIPPKRILSLINLKNHHRRLWQRQRLPHLRRRYNQLNRRVKRELDNFRLSSYKQYLTELSPDDNSLWKATKRILNERTAIPSLVDGGNVYDSKTEKANLLADYFQSAFSTTDTIQDKTFTSSVNSYLSTPLQSVEKPIKYTSPSEISHYIKTLKNRKSPGHDKVPNVVLKNLPRKGVSFLSSLFNACLDLSYFPNTWKHSEIIVIHKSGKPSSLPSSYRPISLLPTFSKLFEKIIKKRLENYLEKISIIPPHQFGFRSHHSTCHQILRVSENIIKGFESKQHTVAVFLDVAQAFDRVWHQGLLYKLRMCGTPAYLFGIVQDFLTERTFNVKIDNEFSTKRPILAGVPQGAILSPLLFNIFTADIPIPDNCNLAIYADDTLIYSSDPDINTARSNVQQALDSIIEWCKKWKITLNPSKCEAKVFTLRRPTEPRRLTILNSEINWNPSDQAIKYLGVFLDKKLSWKFHVNKKLNLAYARLSKFYPILNKRSTIKRESGLLIYKSILRPLLLYACPIWGTATNSVLKRLQTYQNKVLRIILRCPWYMRNKQIHKELGILEIKDYIIKYTKHFFQKLPSTSGIEYFNIGLISNNLRLKPRLPQDKYLQ